MRTCSFFWLKLFLRILIISITNYMIVINFSFKLTPFFYYYHFEPDSGLEIPIRLRFKSDWPPTPDGLQMPTSIGGLDLLWSDAAGCSLSYWISMTVSFQNDRWNRDYTSKVIPRKMHSTVEFFFNFITSKLISNSSRTLVIKIHYWRVVYF